MKRADESECPCCKLTIAVGTPTNRNDDNQFVERFMRSCGEKIICGSSTSKLISRIINKPLKLNYYADSLPPRAYIEGIDMVTEGYLTLFETLSQLNNSEAFSSVTSKKLASKLLKSDEICFLNGKSVNPAYLKENSKIKSNDKEKLVNKIIEKLKEKGKNVTVESF